ncbi:large ribosomal subunit protein mL65 [Engystomops pustulosus]|uniref:large ribosomal subunit protein mL65 n=1 Tax=Engystomops pustulosus TaxID=76066 RepID=UPI003AFB6CEA
MAGRKIYGRLRHNAELPAALLLPPEPPGPATGSLYPPIVASMTARSKASRQRRIAGHFSRVHAQTDVAAKLQLITGLRRLKYVVYPQSLALHADRWYQHFTKTAYVRGLPGSSGAGPGEAADTSDLKSRLCDALLQEHYYAQRGRSFLYRSQELCAAPFLSAAMSVLSSQCVQYNPLLSRCSLDVKPQVNFYWFRGETRVPRGHRKGCIDPIRFQIDDTPLVQMRVPEPLKEIVPLDFVVPEEVPVVPHEPSRMPLFRRQYENKIFIGSKLDDPCKFGHTQFHLVPDKFVRERLQKLNRTDHIEVFLRANAIASLFAWTGAQAMYQGFWSRADVTRPFVSQAVISDGKYFSFFCYQLNTLALDVGTDHDPKRKNICWGTESAPLYEAVENDDIKGFNDEVFRQLVDFFLKSSS